MGAPLRLAVPSAVEDLARKALEIALNHYGSLLEGVAVRTVRAYCEEEKPFVEVFLFLEELPLEEMDAASALLLSLEDGLYSGVAVFTFTTAEAQRRVDALASALSEGVIVYDKRGVVSKLREVK